MDRNLESLISQPLSKLSLDELSILEKEGLIKRKFTIDDETSWSLTERGQSLKLYSSLVFNLSEYASALIQGILDILPLDHSIIPKLNIIQSDDASDDEIREALGEYDEQEGQWSNIMALIWETQVSCGVILRLKGLSGIHPQVKSTYDRLQGVWDKLYLILLPGESPIL